MSRRTFTEMVQSLDTMQTKQQVGKWYCQARFMALYGKPPLCLVKKPHPLALTGNNWIVESWPSMLYFIGHSSNVSVDLGVNTFQSVAHLQWNVLPPIAS